MREFGGHLGSTNEHSAAATEEMPAVCGDVSVGCVKIMGDRLLQCQIA